MQSFRNSPFEGELEVISTLSGDAMTASLRELHEQDKLTIALRHALRQGISLDELSAVSGLTPKAIEQRTQRELNLGEDLTSLMG